MGLFHTLIFRQALYVKIKMEYHYNGFSLESWRLRPAFSSPSSRLIEAHIQFFRFFPIIVDTQKDCIFFFSSNLANVIKTLVFHFPLTIILCHLLLIPFSFKCKVIFIHILVFSITYVIDSLFLSCFIASYLLLWKESFSILFIIFK